MWKLALLLFCCAAAWGFEDVEDDVLMPDSDAEQETDFAHEESDAGAELTDFEEEFDGKNGGNGNGNGKTEKTKTLLCQSTGDPHITPFLGRKGYYNNQIGGDFLFFKGNGVEIHTRHVACGRPKSRVSCNELVAFSFDGHVVVGRRKTVYVDNSDSVLAAKKQWYKYGKLRVQYRHAGLLEAKTKDGSVTMEVRLGSFLNVYVRIKSTEACPREGLCGCAVAGACNVDTPCEGHLEDSDDSEEDEDEDEKRSLWKSSKFFGSFQLPNGSPFLNARWGKHIPKRSNVKRTYEEGLALCQEGKPPLTGLYLKECAEDVASGMTAHWAIIQAYEQVNKDVKELMQHKARAERIEKIKEKVDELEAKYKEKEEAFGALLAEHAEAKGKYDDAIAKEEEIAAAVEARKPLIKTRSAAWRALWKFINGMIRELKKKKKQRRKWVALKNMWNQYVKANKALNNRRRFCRRKKNKNRKICRENKIAQLVRKREKKKEKWETRVDALCGELWDAYIDARDAVVQANAQLRTLRVARSTLYREMVRLLPRKVRRKWWAYRRALSLFNRKRSQYNRLVKTHERRWKKFGQHAAARQGEEDSDEDEE